MYSSKTDQITSWLVFSALLLTTINASIFSNEDTPESETHITEENDQSYLTSMLNVLSTVTKKVTKIMSYSPAMMKTLFASTLILLVATSGAAAENCPTPIKLTPHHLHTCYLFDQPSLEYYPRMLHHFSSLTVAACETLKSGDCADVCSSHEEDISFSKRAKLNYPYAFPPDLLPKKSNFAICPANVTHFEQELTNGQEPRCSDPLETLEQNANITKIMFLPSFLFGSVFVNSARGNRIKIQCCRRLFHNLIRSKSSSGENE